MLTERSIINFLIWTLGLTIGPYLAVTTISGNATPGLVAMGITLVAVVFGKFKEGMAVAPFIGIFCIGSLNFLPFKLSPFELTALGCMAYFVVSYLSLRRRDLHTGSLLLFIPIITFTLIILKDEQGFGLHAFGGAREGGRAVLFIIIATLTYVCGVSIDSPSAKFLSRIPIYCFAALLVFSLPYFVTTYIPAAAPYVYLFSSDINMSAYSADASGGGVVRNQNQAFVAVTFLNVVLAYFPISTWWRPERWWLIFAGALSIGFVLLGGFRNMLFAMGLTIFITSWCYLSWRASLLPLILGACGLVLAQNSHLVDLPESAQRTLSFLPGDWDAEVMHDADGSDDFRRNIINVYLAEYAHAHPWFGNGLTFDSAEYDNVNYMSAHHETPDRYFQAKVFITGKVFHTGWVSLYDTGGFIGGADFIFLCGALIFLTGRAVFRKPMNRRSLFFPVNVFLFTSVTVQILTFFAAYGDVKISFPEFCYDAVLWYHLDLLERRGFEGILPPREIPLFETGMREPVPSRLRS